VLYFARYEWPDIAAYKEMECLDRSTLNAQACLGPS
jgi:hypothetical protein